jgi:type I restriction enzyme S subunit
MSVIDRLSENLLDVERVSFNSSSAWLKDCFTRLQVAAEDTTLGKVAAWYSGSTPSAKDRSLYGGETPFLVISDLTDSTVSQTAQSLSAKGLASMRRIAPPRSVFLSMYGTIGKVGMSSIAMATNQAIAWAECDTRQILPEFLLVWLRENASGLDMLGRGATQRNINREIIMKFPISLPSLEEQFEIVKGVNVFEEISKKAKTENGDLARLRRAYLTQSLGNETRDTNV